MNEGTTILRGVNLKEAYRYCKRLSKHYENFTVGSFMLPREKRKHIWAIYAFCRFVDDLGDEAGGNRLGLLDRWEEELNLCYMGQPRHVIMVALADTIERYEIPKELFLKLIKANRMDQQIKRYRTFEDLLYYCDHSANPVGRLFLYLFGYNDPKLQRLADCTCTALQLTNFWQDIALDLKKGRIYIPQEDMKQFGYSKKELCNHVINTNFIELMSFELERTHKLFIKGLGLVDLVDRQIKVDLRLFSYGGMAILEKIKKCGYDVFRHRPTLSGWEKGWILFRSLVNGYWHLAIG
jgi:squalene synthase HpnC